MNAPIFRTSSRLPPINYLCRRTFGPKLKIMGIISKDNSFFMNSFGHVCLSFVIKLSEFILCSYNPSYRF